MVIHKWAVSIAHSLGMPHQAHGLGALLFEEGNAGMAPVLILSRMAFALRALVLYVSKRLPLKTSFSIRELLVGQNPNWVAVLPFWTPEGSVRPLIVGPTAVFLPRGERTPEMQIPKAYETPERPARCSGS